MSARMGNQTSTLVHGLDHKSQSLPLGHYIWLSHILKGNTQMKDKIDIFTASAYTPCAHSAELMFALCACTLWLNWRLHFALAWDVLHQSNIIKKKKKKVRMIQTFNLWVKNMTLLQLSYREIVEIGARMDSFDRGAMLSFISEVGQKEWVTKSVSDIQIDTLL